MTSRPSSLNVGLYKEFGGSAGGGCHEHRNRSGPGGADSHITGHGGARDHGSSFYVGDTHPADMNERSESR